MNAEDYLDEAKAARFNELESKGYTSLTKEEGSEHAALMFEIIDKKEALGEFTTPFEGKCRRCGREFSNPVPEVTYPEGIHEIACKEWCAECNTYAMSVTFRWSSAYRTRRLHDPMKGGKHASS